MIKYYFISIIVILHLSCEFMDNVSSLHEELTTNKLRTETMSPRNEYKKVYTINYKNKIPQRFDIIEFQFDDDFFDKDDFYSSNQHVSRVIGMPNETIEIKQGIVYINDTVLNQPFLIDSCLSTDNFPRTEINKDFYFVMVDNRKLMFFDSFADVVFKSYDSRKIDPIHKSKIVGITNLK